MSDLANLITNLEADLGRIRREMSASDWSAFTNLLAEAAPCFQQAASDPDVRLEAIYRLQRACLQFPATRRVLPLPGGQIPAPKPAPSPSEPVSGLPEGGLAQRDPEVAELMARAWRLCSKVAAGSNPDGIADRSDAAGEKKTE